MADIELTGWDEFINKAGGLPQHLREEFAGEVEQAANHWKELAKAAAPKDQGFLGQNISAVEVSDLQWDIAVNQFYGPFLEFGTKKKVNIPAGLEAYASQFQGKSGPGNAKVMIYAWMDRVGIPKNRQWVTFLSIIINGIKAQPFLFPQKPVIEKELIDHLQNIVNTEH